MKKILASILIAFVFNSHAATYYIDFDGGNDSNSGTSTNSPWRTIPGTMNTANSAYRQAAWGSITTSSKIQNGDVIVFKGGTTYSAADSGGQIRIGTDYYTDGNTNWHSIKFITQSGYGSGPVIFDGSSIETNSASGPAFIFGQLDGVTWSNAAGGIVIANYKKAGFHWKSKDPSNNKNFNLALYNLTVTNNCNSYTSDAAAAGDGQIVVLKNDGLIIANCTVKGEGPHYSNGISFGESGTRNTVNAWITNNVITGHRGDTSGNDSGIAVKGINSSGTIANNVLTGNLKGMDLGEVSASTDWNSDYVIYGNTVMNNTWGINHSWHGTSGRTNSLTSKVFNNIIVSNLWNGMNVYAAKQNLYVAHNTFAWNGDASQSGIYSGHLIFTFDNQSDTNNGGLNIVIRNNVFFRGYDQVYGITIYSNAVQSLTWDSDFNLYVQSTTDNGNFSNWGYFTTGSDNNFPVTYAAPWSVGSTNGWWYQFYSKTNTPPAGGGTAHYHADGNSKVLLVGNGENAQDQFFIGSTWENQYKRNGTNISSMAWYVPEMAKDINGVTRSTYWTIGAFEGAPSTWVAPPPPPSPPYVAATNSTTITIPTTVANASPYPSSVTLPSAAGTVTNIVIVLDTITHNFDRDVDILLVSPAGTSAIIMSDIGTGVPFGPVTITFSDLATNPMIASTAITSGTWLPSNVNTGADDTFTIAPAPTFTTIGGLWNASNYAGTWSLYVKDDGSGDGGSITSWYVQAFYTPDVTWQPILKDCCGQTLNAQ